MRTAVVPFSHLYRPNLVRGKQKRAVRIHFLLPGPVPGQALSRLKLCGPEGCHLSSYKAWEHFSAAKWDPTVSILTL